MRAWRIGDTAMPNETRVNLKHLLENIRDSYALPIEEVIITELVANALDSKASRIEFVADHATRMFTCVDNGVGMRRQALREYHNIAATTKERGQGIGFAGIGAKLSLLVAEAVVTETRGGHGSRAATEWRLMSLTRAPWKFIPSPGLVVTPRGTAVRIVLPSERSPLLDPAFICAAIARHFSPLLDDRMYNGILKYVYKKEVAFFINNKQFPVTVIPYDAQKHFLIYLGARNRRPVGYGHLVQSSDPLPEGARGVEVSTYGKIIKRGWEWIGMLPRAYDRIFGAVEIPGFAEILTTNKTDFLSDAASLKKYYRFRKAVQEAILPVLEGFGEAGRVRGGEEKGVKMIERQLEGVLDLLVDDFPELQPLMHIARRRGIGAGEGKGTYTERKERLLGVNVEEGAGTGHAGTVSKETSPPDPVKLRRGEVEGSGQGTRKEHGIKIGFEDGMDPRALGRLVEETVLVNTGHPAWQKAKYAGFTQYHILQTVAWVLSQFIEPDHPPQKFVSFFLAAWGRGDARAEQLFKE